MVGERWESWKCYNHPTILVADEVFEISLSVEEMRLVGEEREVYVCEELVQVGVMFHHPMKSLPKVVGVGLSVLEMLG